MSTDAVAPPTPQVLVSLQNVGVAYRIRKGLLRTKKYWALRDVSLDIYRGEALGVVGRNGSGKSTLLRLLAGVISPDVGQLNDTGVRASLLSLGVGFAEHLSGRENAILSGMFLGLSRRYMLDHLDEIVAFAELGEFIDEHVGTYSPGMRARLSFAVAFQVHPDILLIDEILGVGDQQFRDKTVALMRQRISSGETTAVFVSHNARHVRDLCQRCAWVEGGTIRAIGETAGILKQYKGFLGV
jgi:lipopolysaccharide transport system ATP-binding protein